MPRAAAIRPTSAPPRPPLRRRGTTVVARVLDATLEELAATGLQTLRVPAVAERAGVNKTSVYRRWPTKGALVAAALERALGHEAALPDTGSLRTDMRAMAMQAVAFVASPLGRGVLLTLLGGGEDPEVQGIAAALLRARSKGPRALFRRAAARGELAPRADVRTALTAIAGAILHRAFVERAPVTAGFVRRLVDLVACGLESAPARAAR